MASGHCDRGGLGRSLPRALSGGQRQRATSARPLAAAPQLLILDEAVSALGISVQAQVLNLLIDLRERTGVAYLSVSHDLGGVRQISDECVVMESGRSVESGLTDRAVDSPAMPTHSGFCPRYRLRESDGRSVRHDNRS